MNNEPATRLASLIQRESRALLADWRHRVDRAGRSKHAAGEACLQQLIPVIAHVLLSAAEEHGNCPLLAAAREHGARYHQIGLDVYEICEDYLLLRESLYDLAERHDVSPSSAMRLADRVVQAAALEAVRAYSRAQATARERQHSESLAAIAHDVRNPLAAIAAATSTLGLMAPASSTGGPTTEVLEVLRRNVDRLNALALRLVEEAGNATADTEPVGPVERRRFRFRATVEAVAERLGPLAAAAAGARVINAVPPELTLYADPALVERIIENLVGNSLRHARGSVVTVTARDAADHLECSVSDDGQGIPADVLPRLFSRFARGAGQPEGLGLGLIIVRQFVEAQGGRVSVQSAPGKGSVFRFTLPQRRTAPLPTRREPVHANLE
jgi:two-component system, OmpR family, phosphate regulon sensor histidine kinase PhoR